MYKAHLCEIYKMYKKCGKNNVIVSVTIVPTLSTLLEFIIHSSIPARILISSLRELFHMLPFRKSAATLYFEFHRYLQTLFTVIFVVPCIVVLLRCKHASRRTFRQICFTILHRELHYFLSSWFEVFYFWPNIFDWELPFSEIGFISQKLHTISFLVESSCRKKIFSQYIIIPLH